MVFKLIIQLCARASFLQQDEPVMSMHACARTYQKERLILPIHTCFQFSSALSLTSSFSTSHIFINYVACLFFTSCLDIAHSMLMDITWVEMKVGFFFLRLSISIFSRKACRRMSLAVWQTVISFSLTSCFCTLKTVFCFCFFLLCEYRYICIVLA